MSARYERAMLEYRECRDEYERVLWAAYEAAEDGTRGALLNDRGRHAGIDPVSLFMGTWVRARAYASPELLEWWESHPRVTFTDFERSWPYPEDEAA